MKTAASDQRFATRSDATAAKPTDHEVPEVAKEELVDFEHHGYGVS